MLPRQPSRSGEPRPQLGIDSGTSGFETTEARWFGVGRLPEPALRWISSAPGFVEHRCDTYRLDGSSDLGVKRRNQSGLEAKLRLKTEGSLELSPVLSAPVEDWVKLTGLDPADLPEDNRAVWVEVHKVVHSRIYRFDGRTTVSLSADRETSSPGCDVELAAVGIGGMEAWTFALEAWGPSETRRSLLDATAAALQREGLPPEFEQGLGQAMGYPEWLAASVFVT